MPKRRLFRWPAPRTAGLTLLALLFSTIALFLYGGGSFPVTQHLREKRSFFAFPDSQPVNSTNSGSNRTTGIEP